MGGPFGMGSQPQCWGPEARAELTVGPSFWGPGAGSQPLPLCSPTSSGHQLQLEGGWPSWNLVEGGGPTLVTFKIPPAMGQGEGLGQVSTSTPSDNWPC